MSRTLEQQRAKAAWDAIHGEEHQLNNAHPGYAITTDALLKKYEPLVQGAPVTIHTAGFGQMVAFYLSRDTKHPEYRALLWHLSAWVLRAPDSEVADPGKMPEHLMEAIKEESSQKYRRRTADALAYLAWLKRFASAKKNRPAPHDDAS